jgi:endoglucanase
LTYDQNGQRRNLLLALPGLTITPISLSRAADNAGSLARDDQMAFEFCQQMARGINLGNFFEAPKEQYWGMTYDESLLDLIVMAGFTTLRLPVRWSSRAAAKSPFIISAEFFDRINQVVDAALNRGLIVVVNMHHYRQLNGESLDEAEEAVADADLDMRFLSMWQQIAQRFAGYSEKLLFELMNEPHQRLNELKWNQLFEQVRRIVRQSNSRRWLVVGPSRWNNASALKDLSLAPNDRRLIVTIHHYNPFEFTHQGAEWTYLKNQPAQSQECCDQAQLANLYQPLDLAKQWSLAQNRPIWVGEFGSYNKAPMASRLRYTRLARDAFEARGFSWAYWELAAGFGIWDPAAKRWREALKEALLG